MQLGGVGAGGHYGDGAILYFSCITVSILVVIFYYGQTKVSVQRISLLFLIMACESQKGFN